MYGFFSILGNYDSGRDTVSKNIDKLDKKIIHHLCNGTKSHSKLAEKVGASRSTIYRRMKKLKENGALEEEYSALPDYDELDCSSVIIGVDVSREEEIERVLKFFAKKEETKLLWETYGSHKAVAVLVADQTEVPELIKRLRKGLGGLDIEIEHLDISPSISWNEVDLSPY